MAGVEVGTAYVTLLPSARGFFKAAAKELDKEIGDKLDKLIADAFGKRKPAKLPVTPEFDVPTEIPTSKTPKMPVQLDPLTRQFQADTQRMIDTLAKRVHAEIPVEADTTGLRAELGAELAALQRQLKVELPVDVDADGIRAYETKLRAATAEVSERIEIRLKNINVDVDRDRVVRTLGTVFSQLGERAGDALSAARSKVADLGNQVQGAFSQVAGLFAPLTTLAGVILKPALAIGAIVSAASAATAAVYVLGGALASLPAFAAGIGAVVGTLALGFSGIADAFKPVAGGGGGGAARSASALRSAEQGLVRSKRDLTDATKDLNRARADESRRIRDLTLDLKGARIAEKQATLDIADAARDLDRARRSGKGDDIERAQLAYDETVVSLEEAKNRTTDLQAESNKAAKVGVEGSDQVQAALRRQQDATEAVTNAQLALNEALNPPGGGGGGAGRELTKLAPAALAFVAAVKKLKPAFEDLRLNVQQRLFAGLDKTVSKLATAWFPQLNKTLGSYADTFNGFAKDLGKNLGKKTFISDLAVGAESVRGLLEKVGKAVSGPLVDAFGRLSRASAPFIDALGDELGDLITDFSNWIKDLDTSVSRLDDKSKLQRFFETAAGFLHDVFDIGRDVASILGSIITILTGSEVDPDKSPWEGFRDGLDKLAAWFREPENQQKVQDWIDKIQGWIEWLFNEGIPKLVAFVDKVANWVDKIDGFGDKVEAFSAGVKVAFSTLSAPIVGPIAAFNRLRSGAASNLVSLLGVVRGLPSAIRSALGPVGNILYPAGRGIMDGLINGIGSKFGALGAQLAAVGAFVINNKGPVEKDRRMLIPAGQAIMDGLVAGIADGLPALQAQLGVVTDVVAGTALSAGSGLDFSAPAGRLDPAAPALLTFGGDAPDSFLAWMRDNVRIYHGGSAQAAIGQGAA